MDQRSRDRDRDRANQKTSERERLADVLRKEADMHHEIGFIQSFFLLGLCKIDWLHMIHFVMLVIM